METLLAKEGFISANHSSAGAKFDEAPRDARDRALAAKIMSLLPANARQAASELQDQGFCIEYNKGEGGEPGLMGGSVERCWRLSCRHTDLLLYVRGDRIVDATGFTTTVPRLSIERMGLSDIYSGCE